MAHATPHNGKTSRNKFYVYQQNNTEDVLVNLLVNTFINQNHKALELVIFRSGLITQCKLDMIRPYLDQDLSGQSFIGSNRHG